MQASLSHTCAAPDDRWPCPRSTVQRPWLLPPACLLRLFALSGVDAQASRPLSASSRRPSWPISCRLVMTKMQPCLTFIFASMLGLESSLERLGCSVEPAHAFQNMMACTHLHTPLYPWEIGQARSSSSSSTTLRALQPCFDSPPSISSLLIAIGACPISRRESVHTSASFFSFILPETYPNATLISNQVNRSDLF